MPIIAISGGNIDLDHRPAAWLAHAATQLPDRSVLIVDIFDSQESMDTVGAQLVVPSFYQAGVDAKDRRPPAAHETLADHGPAPVRA